MSNDLICNFLAIGQSGTGKSSLLNYLMAKEVFKVSRSATGTKGFEKEEVVLSYTTPKGEQKEQSFMVWDSMGAEAGIDTNGDNILAKWKADLEAQLSKPAINDWFHSVIYTLASDSAVQPLDINMIQYMIEHGYHVIIVVTKADRLTDAIRKGIENCLTHDQIREGQIYPALRINSDSGGNYVLLEACSARKEIRGKKPSEPFGRDTIVNEIVNSFRKTVVSRLPEHIMAYLDIDNRMAAFQERVASYRYDSLDDLTARVDRELEAIIEEITNNVLPNVMEQEFKKCGDFYNAISSTIGSEKLSFWIDANTIKNMVARTKNFVGKMLTGVGRFFKNRKTMAEDLSQIYKVISQQQEELKAKLLAEVSDEVNKVFGDQREEGIPLVGNLNDNNVNYLRTELMNTLKMMSTSSIDQFKALEQRISTGDETITLFKDDITLALSRAQDYAVEQKQETYTMVSNQFLTLKTDFCTASREINEKITSLEIRMIAALMQSEKKLKKQSIITLVISLTIVIMLVAIIILLLSKL